MAIHILGLREYTHPKTGERAVKHSFFSKNWRAKNVKDLFANIETHIEQIPEDERFNMYYTAAHCLENDRRELETQSIIPIDIDNIDHGHIDEYVAVVLETLGINFEDTGIVATGNGLQFIIGINDLIEEEEYFDENKVYYKAMCGNLAQALFAKGLTGDVDTVVFSRGRLLRLPLTKNIKEKKGEKNATMIQRTINYIDFDLVEKSGIPKVEFGEQITDGALSRMPMPDTQGVIEGCPFISWCRDNQDDVSEPEWYAMLSIVGRLEDGKKLAHAFSAGSSSYNEYQTDRKYHQAIEASGPRTCMNISSMFDGCVKCEHYGKCTSPIQLKSGEYLATEGTGFYYQVFDEKTRQTKCGKPCYNDLVKFFERKNPFVTIEEGSMTYTWLENHWKYYPPTRMYQFAEKYFDPKPTQAMCNEVKFKIQRNNIRAIEWFEDISGLLNFQNGVLNMDTMVLEEHDKKIGFKYILPFDYNPHETCPRFDKFLEEITVKDTQLATVLLEFMGYSLSGICPEIGQKALILTGEGSNGKSVFMDVLKYLAGKGNYSALSMGNEINKLENRHQLDGMLFNVSEETPTNAMMDSTVFKALVTGGEVQARKLYCDAYSLKNNAKIIMACNTLPPTKDLSHGMFRRLLIAPFRAKFDAEIDGYDPLIREKLYAEASGIMNKAISALVKFKEQSGFSTSEQITKVIAEYKEDNDDVLMWWHSRVLPAEDVSVPTSAFYSMYKIEQEEDGIKPKTNISFSKSLKKALGEEAFKLVRVEGRVQRCVMGYRLATVKDDDEV